MIEFLWLWAFALLPLPLLVYLFLPAAKREEAALHAPIYQQLVMIDSDSGDRSGGKPSFRLSKLLAVLAWCLLVLAAGQPQWIGEPVQLPTTGRDLMLAVDISGSMEREDMTLGSGPVTRLTAVKAVVGDFIKQRKGDRLGLILFGTQAYLQAPLTFDRNTVQTLLTEAQIGFAGEKTAIGDAIGLAVKRLRKRPENSRLLILLTDGDNTAGEIEPLKAAELAKTEKIKIHTVGVGASEMTVPSFFGSRRINPSADLDEKTLTQIATETGGRYFRARDTQQLSDIYALLDQMEPIEQEAETFNPKRSLYMWPLGLGLLLTFILLLRPLIHVLGRRLRDLSLSPGKGRLDNA